MLDGSQQEESVLKRSKSEPAGRHVERTSDVPRLQRALSASDLHMRGHLSPVHPDIGGWGTVKNLVHFYILLQWSFSYPGKWIQQLVRFVCFVILMLPGFIPPFFQYMFSPRIVKNIVYGPFFRQQLDVYLCGSELPEEKPAPVVIFVSGGAWIIGYKMWGYIMGQLFQRHRVVFVALDYRNYPQATMSEMVQDVTLAVQWVFDNLGEIGGDPDNISLVGQSAGAHLSAMSVLERASAEASCDSASEKTSKEDSSAIRWSTRSLARWIGISGPYDIVDIVPHMRNRGLPGNVIKTLIGKDPMMVSPIHRVRDIVQTMGSPHKMGSSALDLLPDCHIFHGTADATVPWQQAKSFGEVLNSGGVSVHTEFYEGKSHTDPILEDPCEGKDDKLMSDLLELVSGGDGLPEDESGDIWRLQPKVLLRLARRCNPF